jgi:6-phosphogluconolactonase
VTVTLRVEVEDDAEAVARRGAAEIAESARTASGDTGSFSMAVSGGATPWAMFRALAHEDVPWDDVGIWQVDERIAPHGHDDRGLTHLEASLPDEALGRIIPMPVDNLDPSDDIACEVAASAYAATLPGSFDLVHLGLGDDGHTASLVPGDPVLDVRASVVAITRMYRGRRRMTLTYPVLDVARQVLWVVTGSSKAAALRKLVERDLSIPAALVAAAEQLAIVDRAAASQLP